MRRRSESEVVPVDFQSGGAVAAKAEVTDDLPLDSLRDPRHGAVIAVGHAPKWLTGLEAFGDEPDTHQFLHRPALCLPRAALLPVGGHVVLARLCSPGLPSL